MPNLIYRIKWSCKVALSCLSIATIAMAAPLSTPSSGLAPQEKSVQEPNVEKQRVAPDNSKKNKRDANEKHLTPMDQGGSKQDIKITKDIRKEIHNRKGISSNAKNIKIITVDSVVTLRGPVATAEEKQLINEIASKIAGPTKVVNQLEVK